MAMTSPIPTADFWDLLKIGKRTFSPVQPKSKSVGNNGRVFIDTEGPARWIGTAPLVAMEHTDASRLEAAIDWLSLGRSFLAYDKLRAYPAFDPDGSKLGLAAPLIASVGGDNSSIAIEDLPAAFQITAGDLIGYVRSNGKRAIIRACETKVANGSGDVSAFQVFPPLRPGTLAGQALTLIRPLAEFIITPDTKVSPNGTTALSDGLSFDFEESL